MENANDVKIYTKELTDTAYNYGLALVIGKYFKI